MSKIGLGFVLATPLFSIVVRYNRVPLTVCSPSCNLTYSRFHAKPISLCLIVQDRLGTGFITAFIVLTMSDAANNVPLSGIIPVPNMEVIELETEVIHGEVISESISMAWNTSTWNLNVHWNCLEKI